jgi:TonB family protein
MNALTDTLLIQAIEVSLAVSAACVLMLLAGKHCRQLFGARISYLMWLLLPASVLGVLLPAPERAPAAVQLIGAEPGVIIGAPQPLLEAPAEPLLALAPVLLVLWAVGAAITLWMLWRQQRRFRASLGRLRTRPDGVLIAETRNGLPAVVGLRPKVVLPADFEQRFSPEQQALVIAHERVHAERGDVLWNALFALLGALQWFNPLLRLAYRRFRLDQELACDARVLGLHPHARRVYADALLGSPNNSPAAPLACPAFGTHPLKERIAMLSRPLPSARRLLVGAALAFSISAAAAGLAWAKQTPSATTPELLSTRIEVSAGGGPVQRPHLISPAGDAHGFRLTDETGAEWEAELRTVADGENHYRVDLRLSRDGELMSSPRLLLEAGQQGGVEVADADGSIALALQLTVNPAAADEASKSAAAAENAPVAAATDAPRRLQPGIVTTPNTAPEADASVRAMKPPRYPVAALRARQAGNVPLEVLIGTDGRAEEVSINESSGSELLDAAAAEAVKGWTFNSARSGGENAPSRALVPISFSISTGEVAPPMPAPPPAAPQPPMPHAPTNPPAPPAQSAAAAAPPASAPHAPPKVSDREVSYRSMTAPAYPKESVVAREHGVVILRVRVAADGRPQQIEIAHSSGSQRLDQAASASVERWTFDPALRDGRPVDAWIQLPVKFSMDEHTETIEGFDGALDAIEVKAS